MYVILLKVNFLYLDYKIYIIHLLETQTAVICKILIQQDFKANICEILCQFKEFMRFI